MAVKLPGNVSLVWAAIYILFGMFGLPLLLSFVKGVGKKDAPAK